MKIYSTSFFLYSSLVQAGPYVWPGKYDRIEDMLAVHSGYRRFGFSDLVAPCDQGGQKVGITNAAEWIRTAFHDTITHSKEKGTGGLDASIMFELDRTENSGSAFNSTLGFILENVGPDVTVADMIALSVVVSSGGCGGPKIPLRLGRIDATEAGPKGVPEAHTDLKTAMTTFENAGFNQEDMIKLVACGHTLGRVHSNVHPEIVGGTPAANNNRDFDTTGTQFDNLVVTEYMDNSTANPLVVNVNNTLNSDKRIFESDKNVTMRSLYNPQTFKEQCALLLERMIDTVPSTSKLSEPIEIVDVKPYIDSLQVQKDGSAVLVASIRIRTTAVTGRDPNKLEVKLHLKDESGQAMGTVTADPARLLNGQSVGFWGEFFNWFQVNTPLNATNKLHSFDIELKDTRDNKVTLLDNNGSGGYPIQTGIIYQKSDSCFDISTNPGKLSVIAAVREGDDAQGAPQLQIYRPVERPGVMIPKLEIDTVTMTKTSVKRGGYVYYQGKADLGEETWNSHFDVRLSDKAAVKWIKLDAAPGACPPFQ